MKPNHIALRGSDVMRKLLRVQAARELPAAAPHLCRNIRTLTARSPASRSESEPALPTQHSTLRPLTLLNLRQEPRNKIASRRKTNDHQSFSLSLKGGRKMWRM
ncbi:hypothetical protein SRHO_G00052350 [Serrasalmus rhombeus]